MFEHHVEEVNIIDVIFEYDKILEDAKKQFENIDANDINFMSVSHWLVDIGLAKYVKYRFVEKLVFRLREDLWKWKKGEVKNMANKEKREWFDILDEIEDEG